MDGGLVADGELVEPGGQCPVAFEPVDGALHRMAFAVVGRVEAGRPAVAGAAPEPVAGPVGGFGDRGRDAPPPQMARIARDEYTLSAVGSGMVPPGGSACLSLWRAGSGGVLVGAQDGGVHTDLLADQPAASARACSPARMFPCCARRKTRRRSSNFETGPAVAAHSYGNSRLVGPSSITVSS